MHAMVEHDDVRRLEAALAAYAHERRVTGSGTNDVDTRSIHGSCRSDADQSRRCRARERPLSNFVEQVAAPRPRPARRRAAGRVRRDRLRDHSSNAARRESHQATRRRPAGGAFHRARWRRRRAAIDTRRLAPRRALVRPPAPVPPARSCSPQRRPGRLVVKANLSGNNTLTRGRNALIDWNRGRDSMAEAQPSEAGAGEHERAESPGIELGQAGIDVAANGRERRPGEERCELRHPPHAAGSRWWRPVQPCEGVGQGRRGREASGSTIPSRASSRGRQAATVSPSGNSTGRSFALWTATSASPRRSASSSSFTNWRLLSSPGTDACCDRSPVVVMTMNLGLVPRPRAADRRRRAPATARAGFRAWRS